MVLTKDMVDAAAELYSEHFRGWQLCNASLELLRKTLSGWDEKSCLIKSAAINELYGTNIYALVPLARGISVKLMRADTKQDLGLVEILALHPTTGRRHVSFASKLCHFFIDAERYCIFDTVVCETLEQFLGDEYISDDYSRYESFLKNLEALKRKSPELRNIDNIALDRFLWLFGLWNRFSKKVAINAEAASIFSAPPQQIIRRLVPHGGI